MVQLVIRRQMSNIKMNERIQKPTHIMRHRLRSERVHHFEAVVIQLYHESLFIVGKEGMVPTIRPINEIAQYITFSLR